MICSKLYRPVVHRPVQSPINHLIGQCKPIVVSRRRPAPTRAGGAPDSYMMKPITSEEQLQAEKTWLATAMTTWLDEEWTVLPEHQQLGLAAANAYVALRRRGEDDMGVAVLTVASELQRPELAPAFRASFTDPFEVSNKLIETVMLRDGCDVCCTSEADRERIQRVDQMVLQGTTTRHTAAQ